MTDQKPFGRRALSSSLRLLVASLIAFPPSVWANPVLDAVAAGSADISSSGSTLTVTQHTQNAIINWTDFSIAHGELTQFVQPSSLSAALNRVTGGNPSAIYGTLQANGRIFLINPNGVMVGPTGVINTQSFVASTLDVNSAAFLSGGAMTFSGASAAAIVNAGRVNALGGDAVLIARTVENTGQLIAADGLAAMAAGSEVLLMPAGEERVFIKSGAGEAAVGVDQKGEIKAATAELKAAGGNVYGLAINNAGVIRANGVERRGGRVYLTAEGGDIALKSGSVIDASGENGGGGVTVKGRNVTVETGASVSADATGTGDGGAVALLGSESMDYKGGISARGGVEGGNGGAAEVSGLWLLYEGFADLRASRGLTGTLLLDPTNLTISNNSGSSTNINITTLAGQLNAANVTVQTSGSGSQDGDITINNTIAWTSNNTLTLLAHDDLIFNNAGVTNTSGTGALVLTTANGAGNQDITLGGNILTRGAQTYNGRVILSGDRTIASNNNGATGGAIIFNNTINGGDDLVVNSGAGNITFGASVGGTTELDSLTIGAGAGTVFLGAGSGSTPVTIETNDGFGASGDQVYNKAVSLNQNASLSSGGGNITFASTVNGAKTLSVDAGSGGDINFSGLVGNTAALTTLTTAGSGTTSIGSSVSEIKTTGVQTYGEAISLQGNTSLTTANSVVNLNAAVNGSSNDSRTLTLNTGTAGANLGNIGTGSNQRLAALVVTGVGGPIGLNGTVNTNAAQNYTQALNLNGASALTTNNAAITLGGAVNGGQSLTLNSGSAAANLNGTIGSTTRLGTLTLSGSGVVNVNSPATIRTGSQNWNRAVNLLADTTLDSNGGDIAFTNTVNGAKALNIAAGSGGDVSFAGLVGNTAALTSIGVTGTGVTSIGSSVTEIKTTGVQNWGETISLSGNTALTTANSAITVSAANGTANDVRNLTLNAGNAAVTVGNLGTGTNGRLQSVAFNNTGGINLGGTIYTSGAQTYSASQNITMTGNGGLRTSGAAITLNGTVGASGQSLNIDSGNGAINLNNAISGVGALTVGAVGSGGTTNLNTAGVTTTGAQTWNKAVALSANTTLTSGAGGVDINGAVTGSGRTLNIVANSNGAVGLNDVGTSVARLNSVSVTGGGALNLDGDVYTSNAQSYAQNISLGGDTRLDASAGGITLGGTVNGSSDLTLAAGAGDVTLSGAIGGSSQLDSLTITAGAGTTFLNGGTVRTNGNGDHSYGQNVVLGANTTLTNDDNDVIFGGTVNSASNAARTLTVTNGDGNVSFAGEVGTAAGGALGALTITANGGGFGGGGGGGGDPTVSINGGKVNTTGAQYYGKDVSLGGSSADSLFTTSNANVTFNEHVDGAKNLIVSGAANVSMNDDVGGTSRLASLTISGSGVTTLSDGRSSVSVRTTGDQTYNENVQFQSDGSLSTSGGNVTFNGTVNSAGSSSYRDLAINTGNGDVTFNQAVGNTREIDRLSISGGNGTTFLNGATIRTRDDQDYGQKIQLGVNTAMTTTASGDVTFDGTINGAHSLSVATAGGGDIDFNAGVGTVAGQELTTLALTGSGVTTLNTNGVAIKTSGSQSYGEPVALETNAVVTSAGGGVTFAGTINADSDSTGESLTVNSGAGDARFNGSIGASGQSNARLASLTVNGPGTTHINATNVNTTGSQIFNAAVVLEKTATLNSSSNGAITFNSTLDSLNQTQAFTGTTGGAVTFNGLVGVATNRLASLTTNGSGTTVINTTQVDTTGAQTYNATTVSQDAVLNASANGPIVFNSTLGALTDGSNSLTATTGGAVTFNGVVGGASKKLSALTTNGSGTTVVNTTGINTTGAQAYNATTVSQNTILTATTGGAISFNSTLNAATDGLQGLTATTGGVASFNGVVGGVRKLASLTTNGAGSTNINTAAVTTTGNQNYNATNLSQTASLTSTANGAINFNGALDADAAGVQGLTATTGGSVSFNDAVGGARKLASVTTAGLGTTNVNTTAINTTGAQNYGQGVALGSDASLSSDAGAITFSKAVSGAKNLTVNAVTANVNGGSVNTQSQTYNSAVVLGANTVLTSAGDTTFNGAVSGPWSLTSDAANTNVNGGSVNAQSQTYNSAVVLGADAVLTSIGGTIFNGAVSGPWSLISNALTTSLNGGSVNVAAQTYNSAVALGADTVLTSVGDTTVNGAVSGPWSLTSNAANTNVNGGSVNAQSQTYNSAVNLGADAVLTSAGDTTFNGAVAGPFALTSDAANTNVNGGSVSTLKQTYNGAVNLGAATTLDANGSDLTLNGAVAGAHALTLNAGGIYLNGGTVNTGAQQYNGDVILGAHTVLDSNGGNVSFGIEGAGKTIDGIADGAQDLTINAGAGDVNLFGAVGDVHALRSLTIGDGTGTTDINGARVTTTGAQTYGQKVRLSDDTYLKSTNSGDVTFKETVDGTVAGEQGLTVETDGAITFYKDIGKQVALEYLTLIGAGQHTILGEVHTVGNIDFLDDLFLTADLNLFSSGGRIWFHKRVNSAANGVWSLGAHADAGEVLFDGAVGDVKALNLLAADGWGPININGGSVNTAGTQTYGDTVVLGQSTVFTAPTIVLGASPTHLVPASVTGEQTYNGAVQLASDEALTGNSVTLNGAVSGAKALTVTAANIGVNGGSVDVAAQTYNGATTLGANTTLTSAGDTTFNGAVSGPWTLTSNAANTNINGGSVDTLAQAYNGAVNLGANTALNANGAGVDLNGKVNGAYDLIIDASDITLHDAVGDSAALKTLTLNGATILAGDAAISADQIDVNGAVSGAHALTANAANTNLNGGSVNVAAQTYNGALNLGADAILTSLTDTTFGGIVSGPWTLTSNAANTNVNGGSVNTGAQTYNSAVVLGANTALDANGADVTINGVMTGAHALTANGANINLNGGSINVGAQTYNGEVILGADTTIGSNDGAVAFNGGVNGGKALTVNAGAGDVTFAAGVGDVVRLASLATSGSGTTRLNLGSALTTGDQTYGQDLALVADTTLDSVSGDVTLGGAVSGAQTLTVNAVNTKIDGGSVNTGAQTYNSAVVLGANTALNANGADVTLNGAVSGSNALTVDASNINLNGGSANVAAQIYNGALNLGADTILTSLTDTTFGGIVSGPWTLTSNAANTNVNGGSVNTGAQTYNSAVVLGANTTLNANGADVALNGAVSGANTLTIDAANVNLNAGTVNTGAQTYNGELNLVSDAVLTSNGGAVAFNGGVNGGKALTVNAGAGDVTFTAGVGDVVRLASLKTSGSGTTRLNLGSALTTGDQIYGQDLALVADTTLDSVSGDVTLGGAVTGAQTLTVNAVNTKIDGGSVNTGAQTYNSAVVLGANTVLNANGADVTLNGAVSGANTLTIDAANVNLNAGTVNTGAQTYNGELNLVSDAVLTSNGGAVAFNGGVNGGKALTVNAGAGDVTFAAGVGDVVRLASLATSGSGTTRLNLGSALTTGDQTYGQDLALVADTTLDSVSGDVTLGGAVSGAQTLTVNAANTKINGGSVNTLAQTYNGAVNLGADADLNANGADITLNGAVTGSGALTATAANINLNGGSVNAGAQTYAGALKLGADTTLASNGGAVTFSGTVDGAHHLSVDAGAGDVTFADAVGGADHLSSLTVGAGAGTTHIDGGAITTDGDQSYGQKVVLGADAWLASNGGDFNFHKTVNGTTFGGQGLTVDSAAGDITFWDAIGDVMPLKYLTLLGTGAKNLYGAVNTIGNQDYWNDLFLLNDLIINSHGGNVTFHQRVDGAHKLEVNADSGNIGFYGAIGSLMPLSSLILTGTGLTTLADGRVTTNGTQSYGQSVLLAADARLASNGGLITFGKSWSGAYALDVDAGAGTIELNGGTVDTLAQTYTGSVTLGADTTLTSDGGAVTVNGAISGGAHALTVDATMGAVETGSLNTVPVLSGAGDITLNGPVSAGAVTLSGNDVAWNDALSATDLRVFGRDVLMGGDVTTSGNDGVLLVAARSFKNVDSHVITQTGTGRFLIYSVSPANNILGGLTGSTQWSSTYANGPLPGFSGDGFIYSSNPPAPVIIDINLGAINNIPGGNNGNNGLPGFFGDFNGGEEGYVADNWSASPSDIFNWDLGTVRDAVASPDEESPAAKRKRKAEQAKKKSIWFKVPGQ